MENKKKKIDPLPDSFSTEEEAGEFWDTNSVVDHVEYLESADEEIGISERIFEVRVSEDVFKKLQQEADSLHQPVPTVVDRILRKELKAA
jgi:hypothetical protein